MGVKVRASYGELIDDHGQITRCADLLLDEVYKPAARPAALVPQMHDLGTLVRGHLVAEEAVVAMCDAKPLPAPWRRTFLDGRDQFEELRCDWLGFLADWTADVIACDLPGFREAATDVLVRLKERVAAETEGLYAAARQTGAISFR